MPGLVSYGGYIPRFRISAELIAQLHGADPQFIKRSLGIQQKSVPDYDEDTATMAVEAAKYALERIELDPSKLGAIYVGSESHPYAVKPTATIVAQAIGAPPELMAADLEFACKAATAAIQVCQGLVDSGLIQYGMAIGSDVAQSSPGDPLEYATSAGAAAFIIGQFPILVEIEGTCSYTTDTPDFWRRAEAGYPKHGGRFTGEPGYFKHVYSAAAKLLQRLKLQPKDFDYAVFHQPNAKFPLAVGARLGFDSEQLLPGLVASWLGNAYAASSLLGLIQVLDQAKPHQRILLVAYGSGAGADAFSLITTPELIKHQNKAPKLSAQAAKSIQLDYLEYARRIGYLKPK